MLSERKSSTSHRFSALVAIVEHPADMGNSDTTTNHLETESGARVDLWYTGWCGYCRAALRKLQSQSIPFRLHDLTSAPSEVRALKARTGHPTMPQIFLDDQLVGGYDEFSGLLQKNGATHFMPK